MASKEDREHDARRMLGNPNLAALLSDSDIARRCGVSSAWVRDERAKMAAEAAQTERSGGGYVPTLATAEAQAIAATQARAATEKVRDKERKQSRITGLAKRLAEAAPVCGFTLQSLRDLADGSG
jgi:hypothetical protein